MAVLRGFLLLLVIGLPVAYGDLGLIAAFAIVILHILFDRQSRAKTLAARWIGVAPSILLGAAFGFVLSFVMLLYVEPWITTFTGESVDLSAFEAVEGNFSAYIQLLLVGLIVGGIFEELVFRGYVIGWGANVFPFLPAVLLAAISASVFGFAHFYQGITGMISTGVFGFCFGLLYIAAGRKLLVPVAAHMAVNIVGITAIYLGYGL